MADLELDRDNVAEAYALSAFVASATKQADLTYLLRANADNIEKIKRVAREGNLDCAAVSDVVARLRLRFPGLDEGVDPGTSCQRLA